MNIFLYPSNLYKGYWRLVFIFAITIYCLIVIPNCQLSPAKKTIDQINDPTELLSYAQNSENDSQYKLKAAEIYHKKQRYHKVDQILSSIQFNSVPKELYNKYFYLLIKAKLYTQQANDALAIYFDARYQLSEFINQLPPQEQIKYYFLKAEAYEITGNYLAGAQERIFFSYILTNDQLIQENNERIWQDLLVLPYEQLKSLTKKTPNKLSQGWFELALIFQSPELQINEQLTKFKSWQKHWKKHPAAQHTPTYLKTLLLAEKKRPQKVAFLLPLDGKFKHAAQAILNGFTASFFTARQQGQFIPTITVFDTSTESVISLYQKAIKQGNELVIGPLKKAQLKKLVDIEEFPVPVLALNYIHHNLDNEHLFQFGLSSEDEIQQIAETAWSSGLNHAAIIYPNTEWGNRVKSDFITKWENYNDKGKVISQISFDKNSNYAKTVKKFFSIDKSEARAASVSKLLGTHLNYEPRRRGDIDFILLLATPEEARQIKPTFNFYYAHDLKIFSTSHIYSGPSDTDVNKDLNDIYFVDMPWMLNKTAYQEQRLLLSLWPEQSKQFARLHAFGVDIFRIHHLLSLLRISPETSISGATGKLFLTERNQIKRKLEWAKFQNGKPSLIIN